MVSSSCRTQKPSRGRQAETIHDLGRSLFLTSSSSLYMESRSEWSRCLPHTKHLVCAGQVEGPIP